MQGPLMLWTATTGIRSYSSLKAPMPLTHSTVHKVYSAYALHYTICIVLMHYITYCVHIHVRFIVLMYYIHYILCTHTCKVYSAYV